MNFRKLILIFIFTSFSLNSGSWGWNVHRQIVVVATYKLPAPLITFYKKHMNYISKHSVTPDKKSFADKEERFKHFINIDFYIKNDLINETIPNWKILSDTIGKDSLIHNGTLPWTILHFYYKLTKAFQNKDKKQILYYSAFLSHYASDLTVPLHCRDEYDGLNVNQKGIHRLFETVLPNFNIEEYTFFNLKTEYIPNIKQVIHTTLFDNYYKADTLFAAYDSLLSKHKTEASMFVADKYKNKVQNRFNDDVLIDFYLMTNKMTQRQIHKAIFLTSSLWYSAWIDAGQPNLDF